MPLFPAIRGATSCYSGRFVSRLFSRAVRSGERPGGEELRRLRLDDLAPTPRLELLFGLSPCRLALQAGRRGVARLLLQAGRAGLQGDRAELLRAAEARDIPVQRFRRQKLDALCRYQVHQGVCMEVTPLRPRPCTESGEASPGDDPRQLWLILEGLQDPRNLGAVLRSAHFLGVDRVITSRRNSCPLTPVVSKASAGAMEVMDVFSTDDLAGFLQAKTGQGWLVAGTVSCSAPEMSQSSEIPVISCLEFLWDRPTLLVLGNEGSGLSQEVQASCQLLITILPGRQLPPGLESLNVSVATAMLRVCNFLLTLMASVSSQYLSGKGQRPAFPSATTATSCPRCHGLRSRRPGRAEGTGPGVLGGRLPAVRGKRELGRGLLPAVSAGVQPARVPLSGSDVPRGAGRRPLARPAAPLLRARAGTLGRRPPADELLISELVFIGRTITIMGVGALITAMNIHSAGWGAQGGPGRERRAPAAGSLRARGLRFLFLSFALADRRSVRRVRLRPDGARRGATPAPASRHVPSPSSRSSPSLCLPTPPSRPQGSSGYPSSWRAPGARRPSRGVL
ncbi:rRNA methyltransferase 1, mitochondrial [Ctenodactylus gundi]